MSQITYSDVDALRQRFKDLEILKDELARQLEAVLEMTPKISQRGKNRILMALANYPKVPERKLTDTTEIAAFTLSIQIKEAQLVMLTIATELKNIEAANQPTGDTNGI